MSRLLVVAVLGGSLAACSSGSSVEMFRVGEPAQPGCPAPQERVFAYRTCTSMFDPFGWSSAPYQIMQDAASTAPLLALGPAAGAGPLIPAGMVAAQGLQQGLAAAISTRAQLVDQQRALLEFGQVLATAPQAGAPGQTLPQATLQAALASRLTRIVGGEGLATTTPAASATAAAPSKPSECAVRLMAQQAERARRAHVEAAALPRATVRALSTPPAASPPTRAWHVARR